MKRLIIAFIIFTGFAIFFSCQEKNLLNPADRVSKISVQIDGLNAPGNSVWYEAWVMGAGMQSIGILENISGKMYTYSTDIRLGYIQSGLHIIITMENDTVPAASSYKIIAAKIAANSGVFDVGNEEILDFNFETAEARYILDTPTDTAKTNLKRGIWFLSLDTTYADIKDTSGTIVGTDTIITRKSGLDLPELPGGWTYEGWLIFGADTVSTGRFVKPAGKDSTSKYGAGLASGYNFPGEDFIRNAPAGVTFPADLANAEVLITVNPPHPLNSGVPFILIPYKTTIPANSQAKVVYQLENNTKTFPKGNISIKVSIYE